MTFFGFYLLLVESLLSHLQKFFLRQNHDICQVNTTATVQTAPLESLHW